MVAKTSTARPRCTGVRGRKARAAAPAPPINKPQGPRKLAPAPRPAPAAVSADLDPATLQLLPPFPIVGVGASAGGLEAFTQVLHALPSDPGLALVLVQHLAPDQSSFLPQLLSSATNLPVLQASDGLKVEVNRVYVVPPNAQMTITDGRLHLELRPSDRSQYVPVDFFLRSLAEYARGRAIGVILSGTASDGSAGLREIKAVGGITIAQDPETAKYDGMPRAAIGTNAVDLVLAPSAIADELVRLARHPYVRHLRPRKPGDDLPIEEPQLQQVFTLLRGATGVDFTHYKAPTIKRRLQRRMVLNRISNLGQYVAFLRQNPGELEHLYQDILIHVTRFFRDPASFVALEAQVFPRLLEQRTDDQPLRVWVPGCSTGEEPYSVAIALMEFLERQPHHYPVQVFATDISEPSIEFARAGLYPPSIAADVTPVRLRRFFTAADGGYRIAKSVRDLCIFARQDLTRDPPFSKLDLILCRNVLIYLGQVLQKKLIGMFHYALRPSGYLMLGGAETIGPHVDLFALAEKKHKVYRKKAVDAALDLAFPLDFPVLRGRRAAKPAAEAAPATALQAEANRVILEHYAPAGVIVDGEMQIVQFRGQTGPYLEPAPGQASLSLLKMAREGLLHGLRAALHEARKGTLPVCKEGLRVRFNGHIHNVTVEVVPLGAAAGRHFLVLFRETGPPTDDVAEPGPVRPGRGRGARGHGAADDPRLPRLQQELAATRDHMQAVIQDLEAANEELQSANEEILSSNEELQSTNEELDTAKEELQSTNEELNTLNEELHGRNEELTRAHGDLLNLLSSVQIAIVIVAGNLRIRRFTPLAERVLNLIPTDVGRPISQVKPNIDCPDLEKLITYAIDTVAPVEREVQDPQGNWYLLRIRAYKNVDNRIDGAVLALFDVNVARRHAADMREAQAWTQALLATIHEAVLVLDAGQVVRFASPGFCRRFGGLPAELQGQPLAGLRDGQWAIPRLQQLLTDELPQRGRVAGVEVEHEFAGLGRRRLLLNAQRVETEGGKTALTVLAIADVTQRA